MERLVAISLPSTGNEFFHKRIEEVRSFLKEVEYDHSAITLDEFGRVLHVENRTPGEVVRTMKGTCLDGVFYSASKLKDVFGEDMITIVPFVQRRDRMGRFSEMCTGTPHGMYLFSIDGCYGAMSVSREPLLRFLSPVYEEIEDLVMSPQILRGYAKLTRDKKERFLGIMFFREEIRDSFPDYDRIPNFRTKGKKEPMRKQLMFGEAKRVPEAREYLDLVLALD
tara:strand:+ start:1038 stop:1709 length:672 start_codon:yes stop_codon:yes gene_type:complete